MPPTGPEMERIRVGLIQLNVRTNRTAESLERAAALVREAAGRGCRLVVLPEAFATGLNLPRSREIATSIPGPAVEWLSRIAAAEGVSLAAGLLEASGETVFSSAVLVDDRGSLLDVYRRVYIYDLEAHFLAAGSACRVVATPLGRIGLIVGYDVQFPEVLRSLFAERAEIIVCPSILLRPFAASIIQMVRARAAENCCYVLFCSATGENTLAGLTYMGNSMIVQSPVGIRPYSNDFRLQEPVLAAADREETVLVADLDLQGLRRLQAANPLFKDFQRACFFAQATVCAGSPEP